MIIDWLYRTTVETTILIALVLLLRPIVRKMLGAKVAYWLWLLPLIRVFMPDRLRRDGTVLEAIGVPVENLQTEFIPTPNLEITAMPMEIPWAMLWLVGVAAWLMVRVVIWMRFRQALMGTAKPFSLSQALTDKVSEKIHWLPNKVRFFTCLSPSAPFVTGLFKPSIFLPRDFSQRFTEQEQVWVIVHELSHIQRKDLWVQFLGELLRTVFWFNPFIHFAVLVVQEDQELACDHSVLSRGNDEDRYHYGRALLAGAGPQLIPSVMTFFGKGKERFTMLSKHKVSRVNTIVGVSLCAVISVFALTKAPLSIASSQFLTDEAISLEFQEIPLSRAIELVRNFNDIPIFNADIINSELIVSVKLSNVPAGEVFNQLLKCGGMEFIEYETGIELRQVAELGNKPIKICLLTKDAHALIEGDTFEFTEAFGEFKATNAKITSFK